MIKIILKKCLAFAVLVTAACETPERVVIQPLYENLETARSFQVPEAGTAVFRDETTWAVLWDRYWTVYTLGEKTPPPPVDFDNEMVIAIFYGTGYIGCSNWVEVIDEIWVGSRQIEVHIGIQLDRVIGPCDMNLNPLQMVTIQRSDLPVVFTGYLPEQRMHLSFCYCTLIGEMYGYKAS
jgi:hypothetical protein